MFNILFVCMGNICRSPTAEGFFQHQLQRSPLSGQVGVDSAGTHDYHIGRPPDSRAIAEAFTFGIDISGLRARLLSREDFSRFDLILGMDHGNLRLINQFKTRGSLSETGLMMAYAPELDYPEVPDPYYGTQADFNLMCRLLQRATGELLQQLEDRLDPNRV